MEGCPKQFFLKCMLNTIAESTGLRVNYSKSMMVPLNIQEDKIQLLANTFGCTIGSFPFTYMGLPLWVSKPNVEAFQPIVSRCEKRLLSTSYFFTQAGRLQLTNDVFSALPMFAMCTQLLHKIAIKQVDKYRKYCLWRGANINEKKPSKAAWEMVCLPKEGGLGVLQLDTQNKRF